VAGDLYAIQNGRRAVLGQKIVDKLDVKLGENVRATFPDAKPLTLVVVGIFDTGVAEWDDRPSYRWIRPETSWVRAT
jgi:hypothetical protein